MTNRIKKQRVSFWLSPIIHQHLRHKANKVKDKTGRVFGIGRVITEMCIKDNPDLLNILETEQKGILNVP